MKKNLLLLLFVLCTMICCAVGANAAEIVDSGYCGGEGDGTNLTWTLDGKGTLTISGVGTMKNYLSHPYAPWCDNRDVITALIINESVTSIGTHAFDNCSGLTSVTIPNSVTSIGDRAFYACSGMTSITIPDSVTSIGEYAFECCHGLTSIRIPNSIASIKRGTFNWCKGLTNVTLPNGVISIGINAFSGCSRLTNITIPNSITSIGGAAFCDCSRLASVTIPNNVTSIEDYVFYGCKELTDVTIPNGVISIGEEAFFDCSGLTSITIPNSVTSIGEYAFCGCSGLTSVTIPNNVTSIEKGTFGRCSGVTSVTIPHSVNSIGEYAFINCEGLKSVTIPNSVTSIGGSAFSGCKELTSVTIPNGIDSIKYGTFSGCMGLTSVTMPNSVTSIDGYAFSGCKGLTSVTIPNGVIFIGKYAFHNCSGLTNITIPDGVTSIGEYAFQNCEGLTNVTIPNSVTSIGENAFYCCKGLTNVTISHGVTSIKSATFYYCSKLTSVTIPNSISSIEDNAFYSCSSLVDVYYSGTETQWSSLLSGGIDNTGNWSLLKATIHYKGDATIPTLSSSLTFGEQSYASKVGKSITLSATYVAETAPSDIRWGCSDETSVTLTGDSSVLGPIPGQEQNIFYISRPMVASKPGTYTVQVTVNGVTATTQLVVSGEAVPENPSNPNSPENPDKPANPTEPENTIKLITGSGSDTITIKADEVGMVGVKLDKPDKVKWTISPPDVIQSISNNLSQIADSDAYDNLFHSFRGIRIGEANITASLPNGNSASCTVKVEDINPYHLFLNPSKLSIVEGKKEEVRVSIYQNETNNRITDNELSTVSSVVWEIEDGSVAAFDKDGKVRLQYNDISHGMFGNDADSVTVYGRNCGDTKITCKIAFNGYYISKSTTISVKSKDGNELANRIKKWEAAYNSYMI